MKRLLAFWLIVLLGLTLSAAPVQRKTAVEQTKELQPVRDATLIESPTGDVASSAAETIFVGRTGQAENSKRRGLVAFNFSDIPVRARILSVKLTMTVRISASGPRPKPVKVYRVLKSWGEASFKRRIAPNILGTPPVSEMPCSRMALSAPTGLNRAM